MKEEKNVVLKEKGCSEGARRGRKLWIEGGRIEIRMETRKK